MTRLKSISAALCGLLAMSVSGVASAADDYVIIVLDATGSMYPDNWKTAINQAKATVQNYVSNFENTTASRGFAVYTFKTDSSNSQDGIKQVWPLSTTDCPAAQQEKPGGKGTTFCTFPKNDEYIKLLGNDKDGDFDTVINTFGPIDGGPTTPLAKSMCATIDAIKAAAGATNATIVLESDGQENNTPLTDKCGGEDAGVPQTFVTDITKDDYGFPLVNGKPSWQAMVMRRANQYNSPSPDLATPKKGALPSNLIWNVSPIYTFYPATTSGMMALQQLSAQSTSTAQLSPLSLPDGAQPTFTQQLIRAASGLTQPAAVTMTSSGTTSMSRGELGLFSALGKANSRSKYTEFVTVSGQTPVYGVNHKVPGDVDDSGCSDIADYRVIHQKDVWMKRAVAPLQIAIKADLNRDGWVNNDDVPILIANWGKGCKYPVQPPPKI
ncbi:MAG TPA: hypothetical protein VER96_30615 [Polyangiaceae bacterium]|nr:hypothetical protein [Polyangiaceae bacterium]